MTTNKVLGEDTVPCVGASDNSKSMVATNTPRQRGGSRKNDMSTIKEGSDSLPRTGADTRTRLSQTAIINQKLMNTDYLMSKFYQVRKRINMISLFEHYKDITETRTTPIDRLTIKSFRVPSEHGYGYKVRARKMESSIPSKIVAGRMEPNHNYVKIPKTVPVETSVACHVKRSPPSKGVMEFIGSGRSNDNNYTAGMPPTEDRGENKVEEEDDNPFNKSTSNSNNTTNIVTIDIGIEPYEVGGNNDHGNTTTEEEDDDSFDNSVSNSFNDNTNNINNIDIKPRKNEGVWIMKGVSNINAKKNIVMPPPRFTTPTRNAFTALAEYDYMEDNNLYTLVSTLKQNEDNNSFDNYIVSKVGVDNNDALAKIKKVNSVDNIVSNINHSKEGVGTIHIDDEPSTGNNNSNNTIEPSIEPSEEGGGRNESNHNNTMSVGSNEDILLDNTDLVDWKVLDHVPLNAADALLELNDGYLIYDNNTYFFTNNTFFVTVGPPSTLNRSKEGVGTTNIVDVHSNDDDDDTDSDPVSSTGISNDNRIHDTNLEKNSLFDTATVADVLLDSNEDSLIHDNNLYLEKGSLSLPHKISQSTTTINDFIPLSTSTASNDFSPLSTITTINNTCTRDACTCTPYKYRTSNNNNSTTTRACTCTNITTTCACACNCTGTSDNLNKFDNTINTTHACTFNDFNNINNKDFGSPVKNINTVDFGKSGPLSKSQLTTTIPTNNDSNPLNNIYQDTCTTNKCSRSRSWGSNRSTTNNCSHSRSRGNNNSNEINNSTIHSTENGNNNNSNTYNYKGLHADDNNKGDTPILYATNTTTNMNKFYPHYDNSDPLQSNKPPIQIIGIIIEEHDKVNNIED